MNVASDNLPYKEKQPFGQKWVLYFLLTLLVIIISGFICHHYYNKDLRNYNITDQSYITCIVLVLLGILFFYFAQLSTIINEFGIAYKFPPFQFSYQLYKWDQISEIYVREFSAFSEYGGVGYRVSPNGTALVTGSGFGIQIKTNRGESILIGTADKEAVSVLINKYFNKVL